MKRLLILLLAAALVASACSSGDDATPSSTTQPPATTAGTQPSTSPTTTPPTTTTRPAGPVAAAASFGVMADVPLRGGGPDYQGPSGPASLSGVEVIPWVSDLLSSTTGATDKLTANGFVVVPGTTRHFHHIYEGAEYGGWPVFVTTDAAYHVWHLAFDKILRESEQQALLPALEDMVVRLVGLARAQEAELAGTDLGEAADRVTQFYEAAAAVLEVDVGEIGPLAAAEVDLIDQAAGPALSPTVGGDAASGFITTLTDYSLFRPRGHYTRNADLERFFRAMSQLGNNAFLVDSSLELGILASRVVATDPEVTALWQLIYEPTAWLVGAADDYTPFEVGAVVEETVASGWSDPAVFADPAIVAEIRNGLLAARTVAINPEASSVRIMGSRWVIDSYVLDQLVMPNVAREEASPLDLAAAFGSQWAYDLQAAAGETAAAGYDEQLAVMQDLIASRDIDAWSGTVYDAWLYALQPMWQPHGSEYPEFMRGDAWAAKAHQAGFGSYAELKHDTILYTKQAVAEGGGEEPPAPPRHWVEPEPVVFERLAELTALMADGLGERNLLPSEYAALLADLETFYRWLGGLAADELAGLPISDEDNFELSWVGATLEGFWLRTSDTDIDFDNGPDSHAALIADIMRNQQAVLEVGTGYVDTILVLVPDDDGDFQVAVGGVYSYYEFWNDQRLTDEEWRAELDAATNPPRPAWQQVFLAGEPPAARNATGIESGLLCRDLDAMGYGFFTAVGYWMAEGAPARMDADGNGIPCETVFDSEIIDGFLSAADALAPGLRCADLGGDDDWEGMHIAVAYWMLQGAPARMDADGNGIPCETRFSPATVREYLSGF